MREGSKKKAVQKASVSRVLNILILLLLLMFQTSLELRANLLLKTPISMEAGVNRTDQSAGTFTEQT